MDKNKDIATAQFKQAILRASGDEPLVRWVSVCPDGGWIVRSDRSYKAWTGGDKTEDGRLVRMAAR